MKTLFNFSTLLCLLLVLTVESRHSFAQGEKAKDKPTFPTITHAEHAYAKDFEKYGISDEYKNRYEPYGLTTKEKQEVNKLIDDSLAYLISRITKSGEILELQETPDEDAFKKLNRRKPDTWYAYYRGECVVEAVRAALCTQKAELSKEDSRALLKALDFAMKKFAEVKFDIGHHEYLPYSLADYAGRIVALDEELGTVPHTADVKKARKSIKKEAKRCLERIIDSWDASERRLFNGDIDLKSPGFVYTFRDSSSIVRAITTEPKNADKDRVKIAEGILELLVNSAMIANDIKFPRYIEANPAEVKDDAASKAGTGTKKEATTLLDAPLQWSDRYLAEKYYADTDVGHELEEAKRMREKVSKKWEYVGSWLTTPMANTMFLDTYSLLRSANASKYMSKEGAAILERAAPMIWNLRAFCYQAYGVISPEHTRRLPKQTIESLSTSSFGSSQRSALYSVGYELTRIAAALKITSFGKYDWYAMIARKALNMRAEDRVVYARSASDSDRSFLLNRFANNLYVLLILRKQEVEEAKPTEKGEGSEAKPTEGKNPKAPAKAPEKTSDDKANKPD